LSDTVPKVRQRLLGKGEVSKTQISNHGTWEAQPCGKRGNVGVV